ncbi:MAG: hypothetical protein OEY77_00020 [Nitrospira sp.]|nr:hypothetical protein [Nitrospira sp.]
MPQKFLSIKNFEKYQHFKKSNPPWIKLYRSTLSDRDFINLPTTAKYVYIGLLMLASEGCNKVFNDHSWISHRLAIKVSELDLKPLYKAGFLIASESTVYRETISQRRDREETETETETETEKSRVPMQPLRASVVSEDFWSSLGANPAYQHIDLAVENGKMDAWLALSKNKRRKKTRQFVLNWLNKIEQPMQNGNGRTNHAPIPPFPGPEDPIARGQWRKLYGDPTNPRRV